MRGKATTAPGTPLSRYGIAVMSVAAALGLKLLLDPIIVQETPFRLMVGAVVVSAWYGGLGPGLLATVVGGLITDYFFLPPINSISGLSTESVPLMLFLLRFAYKAKGGEEIPIFLTPTQVAGIIVEPR